MSEGELIIPKIPDPILTIFENDYPQLKELLDYKRDATLIFLKSSGAMAIYRGSLGLECAKDVKDWAQFIQFSKDYTQEIVQAGLQKYQAEEEGLEEKKKQFNNLNLALVSPAVEMISSIICEEYLNKFPNWSNNGVTQEDYIKIDIKCHLEYDQKRIYWACRGIITVKDTKYESPRNGCFYRAEFYGKPEFLISYFDLEKLRQSNEMAKSNIKLIKDKLDELDEKLLNQKMEKLLLNGFDF